MPGFPPRPRMLLCFRRCLLFPFALLWLSFSVCPLSMAAVLPSPAGTAAGPAAVRVDPNTVAHPESSLADFRFLQDAPAGKHGFLTVRSDGHFYFEDGTRARFWGINIASTSVFQPHRIIDEVVDSLARAGINLVRIHDIDDRGGIIDYSYGDSQHFAPSKLRAVDYWIARCKQAGIYIYLDLLDYRTFTIRDGVPNANLLGRAAKPYALFDPRLIELQKEYARHLLVQHVNPFTQLSFARDPAVCMLELYDENGLFIKRTILEKLASPYQGALNDQWNAWLKTRYGSTAGLSRAWTNTSGLHALQKGESLEQSSVSLPQLLLHADWNRPYTNPAQSPARVNDAALFAYTVQADYGAEMKAFLRREGVRIPMTAVGSPDAIPDVKSIADSLDFIGNNFYWDHPSFHREGSWHLPSSFTGRNPIQSIDGYSFGPTTAFLKVSGKPVVLREWNYCWPNSFRDAGMLEAAVYACLQDVDAMILFTYDTPPNLNTLSYFDVSHDPCRWFEVGPLAAVFLKRLVAPARRTVDIGYSYDDIFHYYGYLSSIYAMAWQSRVQNVFFNDVMPADGADAVIASGHSAAATYPGTHSIIRTNDRYAGLTEGLTQLTAPARSGYNVACEPSPISRLTFSGDLFPSHTSELYDEGLQYRTGAVTSSGYAPIGLTADGSHCLGFYDAQRQNYVFQDLDEVNALRVTLDAMRRWYGAANDPESVQQGRFTSDTGELVRDSTTGVLQVNTPLFQAVAGHLQSGNLAGSPDGLRVRSQSDEGTVMALSLDGKPLATSRRFLVQMVTGAMNTGQQATTPVGRGRPELVDAGKAPIRTLGEPISDPTEIWFGDRQIASIYLHAGTWMMLQDGEHCTFYCDTPQVKVQIARFSHPQVVEPSAPDGPPPAAVVAAASGDGFLTPSPGGFVRLDAS